MSACASTGKGTAERLRITKPLSIMLQGRLNQIARAAFIKHSLTITEAVMLWYYRLESSFAAAFVIAAAVTLWLM